MNADRDKHGEDNMNTLKVLLVDDHERFRKSVASFLCELAFVEIVGEAANGEDAILQTEKLHPDLVLMDLDMPERDGFQATREIKLRVPRTKVVILSMHDGEAYRRMAWRHSADGFIDKAQMKVNLLEIISREQGRLGGGDLAAAV
jgi:DNA-binding NarL/FixJ family response regulator